MIKKIIFYIILIAVILFLVFLSQNAISGKFGGAMISGATDQASEYLTKGSNWVSSNIYSKITGEVEKRGEEIQNELNQQKEKVTEGIINKVENYFSGVANSLAGKNNCEVSK